MPQCALPQSSDLSSRNSVESPPLNDLQGSDLATHSAQEREAMLSSQGADEATFDQLLESMSSNTSTQTQPTSGPTGMLASVPPISDADRLLTSQELNQLSESVSRVLSYKGCTVDELHTALESTTFRQLVQLHDHFIEEGKGNLIGSMSLIYENAGMRSEFYAALAFCMAASSQQSAQPSRMCRNEARIAISLALEAASYLQDNNGEALARRLEMVHESPNFHFTVQAYDLIFGGTPGQFESKVKTLLPEASERYFKRKSPTSRDHSRDEMVVDGESRSWASLFS